MGRLGACGDNAAMESFFALLHKNVLDHRSWGTREGCTKVLGQISLREDQEHGIGIEAEVQSAVQG